MHVEHTHTRSGSAFINRTLSSFISNKLNVCLTKSKVKGACERDRTLNHTNKEKCFANGKPRNKKAHKLYEEESVNETNMTKWHKCKRANNEPSSIAPNTQRHHFCSFHTHRLLVRAFTSPNAWDKTTTIETRTASKTTKIGTKHTYVVILKHICTRSPTRWLASPL